MDIALLDAMAIELFRIGKPAKRVRGRWSDRDHPSPDEARAAHNRIEHTMVNPETE
jgi:hypothetical protein